jgi:hypothetical protein
MKQDTTTGLALVNVIRSESVSDLGKEALEIGIDAALDSGLLKDIPLVNMITGVFNVGNAIRNQLLTKKIIVFISKLSDLSKEERETMIEELDQEGRFAGRVGSALIEILDRMESERKPDIAAKCFAAFARGQIDYTQLRRLLVSIERLPSFDIGVLRKYAESTLEQQGATDQGLLISLVNAGLAQNNGGWGGGTIVPTNLCNLFLEMDLDH